MTDYKDQFLKALVGPEDFPNKSFLDVLDSAREAVQTFTSGEVNLTRERGFVTNLGQEWRFRLTPKGEGAFPVTTLFRAHVPLRGSIYLDLGEENMIECLTPDDASKALQNFFKDQNIRETLLLLKK
jgi:hypothetical protein